MNNFAAIDFETANECPSSICAVGVVVVRNGQLIERFYSPIRPTPNYYQPFCQRIHGLSDADTCNAPSFPEVWIDILVHIFDLPLVAHNAQYDENCLIAAFEAYGMDYPHYRFYDTLSASRQYFGDMLPNHKLPTVAKACGYNLKHHHHPLADAEACAFIALQIL